MKIAQINVTCGAGSTGKIAVAVSRLLSAQNVENYVLYSHGQSEYPLGIKYTTDGACKLQALFSRISGEYGFVSQDITKNLIAELDRLQPDTVHLHNLHAHNCNLDMLFSYFKEKKTRLFWTFHDCWAFTGYCPHYDGVGCQKWQESCGNCPQKGAYTWFTDKSKTLFERKKALFTGLDLTIITPSQWLADEVKKSFLKDYPVRVIHNGIDLHTFRPTESDFRQKHGLEDKKVLLGVAYVWEERKGVDVFIELAKRLSDEYKIVLVGTDESVEQRLPKNIHCIRKTQNQEELAEIYTAADLFVNATREDNFPTVNIEALACGTPVLTFATGGSGEIADETCGASVPKNDVDALQREIERICTEKPYSVGACTSRAQNYNEQEKFLEYLRLYE